MPIKLGLFSGFNCGNCKQIRRGCGQIRTGGRKIYSGGGQIYDECGQVRVGGGYICGGFGQVRRGSVHVRNGSAQGGGECVHVCGGCGHVCRELERELACPDRLDRFGFFGHGVHRHPPRSRMQSVRRAHHAEAESVFGSLPERRGLRFPSAGTCGCRLFQCLDVRGSRLDRGVGAGSEWRA